MAADTYSKEQLSRLLMTNAVSDHNQNDITKILLKKVKGDEKIEKSSEANIEKSGEGSRGGVVIGHTQTGKPIYANANHPSHASFNHAEHQDAIAIHNTNANAAIRAGQDHKPHMNAMIAHHNAAEAVKPQHQESEHSGPTHASEEHKKKFEHLVRKRISDPENMDHHDDLNAHVKQHHGEAASHYFAETFDPNSHSVKEAHRVLKEAKG